MINSKLDDIYIFINDRFNLFVIIIFVLAGLCIYSNSFDVPFLFDDSNNIQNPSLKIDNLSFDTVVDAGLGGTLKDRPVANISFAINYYFSEYNVHAYHLVNISIHIFAGILLYYLVFITLSLPVNSHIYGNIKFLAFISAFIWLVHPLATQSVTYVVQRMNSMAALFYVMSLLSYAKARICQQKTYKTNSITFILTYFGLSAASGLIAIGSKENAATLPVALLFYEFYFFQHLSLSNIKKHLIKIGVALALVSLLIFFYLGPDPWRVFFSDCSGRYFTAYERLITQFRIIIHYMSLILFPSPDRLVFDYNFPLSTSLTNPITTLYSFISLIGLLVLIMLLSGREKLLSFCLLWFLLTLSIESSVICLELIFEHRTYLPSMFLILFFVLILYRATQNKTLLFGFFILLSFLFGHWTFERNKIWQDPVTFWLDSVKKNPNKPRSLNNLGSAYAREGENDKARHYFQTVIQKYPKYSTAHMNLGILSLKESHVDEAEHHFFETVRLNGSNVPARINLAFILWKNNNVKAAFFQLEQALLIVPDHPYANKLMGHILLRKGRVEDSLSYTNKGLEWLETDTELLLNKAEALLQLGRSEEAIYYYNQTLETDKGSAEAHYNLGMLFSQKGEESKALFHYREAVRLSPIRTPPAYNLANTLLRKGFFGQAETEYRKILFYRPVLANTLNNLGLTLEQQGKIEQAIEAYRTALEINKQNGLALSNLERLQHKNGVLKKNN